MTKPEKVLCSECNWSFETGCLDGGYGCNNPNTKRHHYGGGVCLPYGLCLSINFNCDCPDYEPKEGVDE